MSGGSGTQAPPALHLDVISISTFNVLNGDCSVSSADRNGWRGSFDREKIPGDDGMLQSDGAMKASLSRWELPLFLVVFLVLFLSFPMIRGLRSNDVLSFELDQMRRLWFEEVVLGTAIEPDVAGTRGDFDLQRLLEESQVSTMGRFSPELKEELRQLVVLTQGPPSPETLRATERKFSEVWSIVSYLESQSNFAYQSLLAFLMLLIIGFAVAHRQQGVRIRALASERENVRRMQRLSLTVQEQERHRIARELHDETAQSLALARMIADQLGNGEEPGRLRHILSRSMQDIRNVCERMRPPLDWADKPGEMIHSLCASLKERYPLRLHLSLRGDLSVDWDDVVFLHLYRIAQESLINVIRHAGTDEAWVSLEEEDTDKIRLTISDKGRGLCNSEAGLGRRGIMERAELIGATLRWFEPPGGGTGIELTLKKQLRYGSVNR